MLSALFPVRPRARALPTQHFISRWAIFHLSADAYLSSKRALKCAKNWPAALQFVLMRAFLRSAKKNRREHARLAFYRASDATNRIMCGIYSWQVVPLSLSCMLRLLQICGSERSAFPLTLRKFLGNLNVTTAFGTISGINFINSLRLPGDLKKSRLEVKRGTQEIRSNGQWF